MKNITSKLFDLSLEMCTQMHVDPYTDLHRKPNANLIVTVSHCNIQSALWSVTHLGNHVEGQAVKNTVNGDEALWVAELMAD